MTKTGHFLSLSSATTNAAVRTAQAITNATTRAKSYSPLDLSLFARVAFIAIALFASTSALAADTNEHNSSKRNSSGNGFLIDLGYARYGGIFDERHWYSAPFQSEQSGNGFTMGAKLALFNKNGNLGAHIKGQYTLSSFALTNAGNIKFGSYSVGADAIWRFPNMSESMAAAGMSGANTTT